MSPEANDAGRGIRDQISRYSGAFAAVVGMILLAALVGGYILSQERLSLPGWVPIFGRNHFALKAEFRAGDALTPGQGQAVTIAGAKIGEIGAVETRNGVAVVTMEITPKYARDIYRDATLIMRPQDAAQGPDRPDRHLGSPRPAELLAAPPSRSRRPRPTCDFDQFLAALDAETRVYLQSCSSMPAMG